MCRKSATSLTKLASLIAVFVLMVLFMPRCAISADAATVPSGATQYKGHTYYVYQGVVTWKKAKALCEAKGGHLVTITSSAENNFVKELVNEANIGFCWLGATDEEKEGTWKWVTGESFKFTDWYSGQPDDYGTGEDYLSTYYGTQWNDYSNDSDGGVVKGYVCEWDMTKKQANAARLNKTSTTLTYGSTEILKVLNNSAKVTWSSSKKTVATVSAKGVVTAKGIGTATITAKVGSKQYTCKVTVKDVNTKASVKFKTTDSGYFISGTSSAKITVTPKSNCAKATVTIVNASGTKVYSKTYTSLKKGKSVSFTWNGKNSKGTYVAAGSYRVKVTIGTKNSYSSYLSVKAGGEFAGGTGSKSNPFQVSNLAQLKKIEKYNGCYFKQTADIDCGYETLTGFFAESNPFTGNYNGNGKTISNLFLSNANSDQVALFIQTDAKAVISNLTLKNVYVTGSKYVAALVKKNCGKIQNCTLDSCNVSSSITGADSHSGILAQSNETGATISGCVIKNCTISAAYGWYHGWTGGIVGENLGSVMDCSISDSTVSTTSTSYGWTHGSALVASNIGTMLNCTATRVTLEESSGNCEWSGGIASTNIGTIIGCSFVDGTANNPGIESNSGTFIP